MVLIAVYIGQINNKFYHTYSKTLRDKYFEDNYVTVFTLGTGKSGGTKIRGTEMSLKEYEQTHIKGKLPEFVRTESGKLVH